MKEFLRYRPLFVVCASMMVSAVVCTALDSRKILAFAIAIAFSALFPLTFRFEMRRTVLAAIFASLMMALSFFFYARFVYEAACRLNDQSFSGEFEAIGESSDTLNGTHYVDVKCLSADAEGAAGVRLRIYYSDEIGFVPSAGFTATVTCCDESRNDKYDPRGVHLCAYAETVQLKAEHHASFAYYCYRIRSFVRDRIRYQDAAAAAFERGMLLGDKSGIDPLFRREFISVGMAHVFAVSGMHLLFAVLFFDFLLALFGVRFRKRSVLAIFSILIFVVISGFSISCIRAAIMLTVYYLGRVFDRYTDGFTALAFAAALIVFAAPYTIGSPSFVLSVSATAGLILLVPRLQFYRFFRPRHLLSRFLLRTLCTACSMSAAAMIACLPAQAVLFQKISFLSPLSNVMMILPIEIMCYLGFSGILLSFFPPAVAVIGGVNSLLYRYLVWVTELECRLPLTSLSVQDLYYYIILFLALTTAVGVCILKAKMPEKKVYPYVLCCAVICLTLCSLDYYTTRDVVTARFVDVGQGNCTVFTNRDKAVVVDCGGSDSNALYRYLSLSDWKEIELLAITHTDDDHVNMLRYLVSSCKIRRIVIPYFCDTENIADALELAQRHGTEVVSLYDDATCAVFGNASVSAFVELAKNSKRTSNTGASYLFCYRDTRVMCTGDMDIHQEYAYLDYGERLDCDILVAAHHGSDSSSSARILALYSPNETVISVGRNNIYGLPGKKALRRIEKVSRVLRTDEQSTVVCKIDRKGYRFVEK